MQTHARTAQRNVLLALGRYDYRTHRGVARYAGQHHWHLNGDMGSSGRLPRGWSGDGIITALDFQTDLVRFIRSATAPVVDISLNRQDIILPRVVGDHYLIGRMAAEHFVERGFRHFAWHANDTNPVAELRCRGFTRTLAQEQLACQKWIWKPGAQRPADHWLAKSRWLADKLKRLAKPAAVLAFSDADAANVLDACLQAGLAVPDEVAILGVDNNEVICESLWVPLSSVFHDLERVGYEGAALLDRLMRGQSAPAEPILIQPRGVVVRRSTEVLAIHHEPSRRALVFMQENYRRNIGASDAAQASGIPRRTLDKAFREYLGRSVREELARIRLTRSRELLLQTKQPVAEIAAAVGFNTAQYFNNVFRQATGTTPRKFRLAHNPTVG